MTAPHNIANDLATADFPTSGWWPKTPEGRVWGWGKTVGNGVEGWAPNAFFVHTDGVKQTRTYRNTGTSSSATWTSTDTLLATEYLSLAGTAYLLLVDNAFINLGTGQDVKLMWNGSYLEGGPSTGLWAGAPSKADPQYHAIATEFFDDFNYLDPIDANLVWHEEDDAGTGTNALTDAANGVASIITAANDNDYHAISSLNELFLFASGKKLWLEARFKLAEQNTNESAWWFGLTDTLTTGGLQTDASGPLTGYDGALIWKDEGTMTIDFETSNNTTQLTASASLGTFVTNTWTRVGFYFDGTATTSIITPYADIGAGWVLGEAENITLSGLQEMHLVAGVKTGPSGAAETLSIDYIKVVQLR